MRQHFDYHGDAVARMAGRARRMPKCANEDPSDLDLDADDNGPDFHGSPKM